MTGRKSDQKQEHKPAKDTLLKYKELSGADKEDAYVKVPILEWEINISKSVAREGAMSVLNGNEIFNTALMHFIRDATPLIVQAVKVLSDTSIGKAAPEDTSKALDALQEFTKGRDELECQCCAEVFNMMDLEDQRSPAINSIGETYCKSCMLGRGAVAFSNTALKPLGEKEDGKALYSLINHPLVDCLNKYIRFTMEFIDTVKALLPGAAQPVAEEKSSHATTKKINPEMVTFLLEMGVSWRLFPVPDFYAVFEKLSLPTQQRCFTVPVGNDTLLCRVCVNKDSLTLPKALFNMAKQFINKPDAMGRTPLMQAVAIKDTLRAEALLSVGANINVVDNAGNNILHYLACLNDEQFQSWSPFLDKLHDEFWSGEPKKGEQKSQVDKWASFIDAPNQSGFTPLVRAVQDANFGIMFTLIGWGADPNQPLGIGMSLLMHMVYSGVRESFVRALIDNGASVLGDLGNTYVGYSFDDGKNLLIVAMEGAQTNRENKIFTLILDKMEEVGKIRKCMEQVNDLKQGALKFAAKKAQQYSVRNPEFYELFQSFMKTLLKYGTRIPEDFVTSLEDTPIKKSLQECLDSRNEKIAKNKKKKEGKSKPAEKPAETKSSMPMASPITITSAEDFDNTRQTSSSAGSAAESNFPNPQSPAVEEIKALPPQIQSSSLIVTEDINPEVFKPMLETLKDPPVLKKLKGQSAHHILADCPVEKTISDALHQLAKKCMQLSVNEQGQYSRSRQAKALTAVIDALGELFKPEEALGSCEERCLGELGKCFIKIIFDKKISEPTRAAAAEIFSNKLKDKYVIIAFKNEIFDINRGEDSKPVKSKTSLSYEKNKARSGSVSSSSSAPTASQESPFAGQLNGSSMWNSPMAFHQPVSSPSFAEFKKTATQQAGGSVKPSFDELMALIDSAENKLEVVKDIIAESQGLIEIEKEERMKWAKKMLDRCFSEIESLESDASQADLSASERTRFGDAFNKLAAMANSLCDVFSPPSIGKNTSMG